jgi:DNA-binding CsgD family transcriptional regulator
MKSAPDRRRERLRRDRVLSPRGPAYSRGVAIAGGETDDLVRGRAAYDARAWDVCRDALAAVDKADGLGPPDLKLYSIALYLTGNEAESLTVLARAHKACLEAAMWREAAQTAFWAGWILHAFGDRARGSGWIARARSLVEEHALDGVEPAMLASIDARERIEEGDLEGALELAAGAARVGRDLGDRDVQVLGMLTVGQVLIMSGRPREALPHLDEVMVAVSSDELTPTVAGLAYCAVIAICMQLDDLRRAREWTNALGSWCDTQSGLVPYRGQCLVHRAQIMTMEGSWPEAVAEARTACAELRAPAVGDAWYQLGEVHRLRGEFTEAEDAYRRANEHGRQPEPGLAQLRFAQGRPDAAATTLRRLVDEPNRWDRDDILFVHADVMIAVGDLDAARAAADELAGSAGRLDAPLRRARAAESRAAVLLAGGQPHEALSLLRNATQCWQDLGMPYDAARVRVRIGDCLRAAGDADSAAMEYDAARLAFERLGAHPDLARLGAATPATGGLTAREAEVVRLVATGLTNRAVADALFLSEKTVARHLANVYGKLGISSRSAATAWAYEQGLV